VRGPARAIDCKNSVEKRFEDDTGLALGFLASLGKEPGGQLQDGPFIRGEAVNHEQGEKLRLADVQGVKEFLQVKEGNVPTAALDFGVILRRHLRPLRDFLLSQALPVPKLAEPRSHLMLYVFLHARPFYLSGLDFMRDEGYIIGIRGNI